MESQNYTCPLCYSNGVDFYSQQFQKCSGCHSIFRCPEFFISPEKEKSRYEEHNNDVEDTRYQDFVSPIIDTILQNHSPSETWLDFWAGTWPVISHLLTQKWFQTQLYDPFFHNKPELLKQEYDFIIACEVIEHFHYPEKEFHLLYKLLKPGGKLYIMTDLYSQQVDFKNWYYKNDKTHVFFYTIEAFTWIKSHWSWEIITQKKRCIILEK